MTATALSQRSGTKVPAPLVQFQPRVICNDLGVVLLTVLPFRGEGGDELKPLLGEDEKAPGVPVADCSENDAKGKIAKLQTKFELHQTDVDKGKCLDAPDFAYAAAADVVAAVKAEQNDFFIEVLGDHPENTITDATDKANKPAAICQAILMKVSDKLVQTRLKEFGTCVKKGLKAKESAERIVSAVTAEKSCWDETGPAGAAKIQKAVEKHADLNVKKCVEKGADYENVLDGRCNGEITETEFAECIDEIAACTACLMINDAFDFNLDCDARDNSVIDGSCGGGGSAAGSFVDGPVLY